jgi:hypothetical protein
MIASKGSNGKIKLVFFCRYVQFALYLPTDINYKTTSTYDKRRLFTDIITF